MINGVAKFVLEKIFSRQQKFLKKIIKRLKESLQDKRNITFTNKLNVILKKSWFLRRIVKFFYN